MQLSLCDYVCTAVTANIARRRHHLCAHLAGAWRKKIMRIGGGCGPGGANARTRFSASAERLCPRPHIVGCLAQVQSHSRSRACVANRRRNAARHNIPVFIAGRLTVLLTGLRTAATARPTDRPLMGCGVQLGAIKCANARRAVLVKNASQFWLIDLQINWHGFRVARTDNFISTHILIYKPKPKYTDGG